MLPYLTYIAGLTIGMLILVYAIRHTFFRNEWQVATWGHASLIAIVPVILVMAIGNGDHTMFDFSQSIHVALVGLLLGNVFYLRHITHQYTAEYKKPNIFAFVAAWIYVGMLLVVSIAKLLFEL